MITLTVTGHEEIIASLNNLSNKLQGPELVQTLGQEASIILAQETPVGERGMTRGLLQRTMSEAAGPEPTGQGWWVGVGNLEGIYPLEPAPPDTIKNFLEMMRGSKKKTTRRHKAGAHFNPKHAWWYLPEEEKKLLRLMRETGRQSVGGASPYRPFYWHIQDVGMPMVRISGSGYIARAIGRIKAGIANAVTRHMVSRGPVITGYNQ